AAPTIVSARCWSVRNTIRLGLRITGVKTADGVSREVRSFRNIGISACAPSGVALLLSSAKVSVSIRKRAHGPRLIGNREVRNSSRGALQPHPARIRTLSLLETNARQSKVD